MVRTSQSRLLTTNLEKKTDITDVPPENDEPPPPFPFPTSSSSRLPPTFTSQEQPPIPNSPPPGYELVSAPPVPSIALPESETNRSDSENRPVSRASTRYESAPSSPVIAPEVIEGTVEDSDEDRNDRRMWNEDLLAGYSLEERVQREFARRGSKQLGAREIGSVAGRENASPMSEGEDPVTEPAEEAASLAEEPAAVTAVQSSLTANESSDPQPITSPPLASPLADLPAEEEATYAEPTVAEESIKLEAPHQVEPTSSPPITASPVVPAVELDTRSMPTDEPVESSAQEEAVSETPVESQVDVEIPSQPKTDIQPTPPPVNSTPPKVPEVLSPVKPAEPVAEPEIVAPTPRTVIPRAREVPEVSRPIKAVEPEAKPDIIAPTARPVIQSASETPKVSSPIRSDEPVAESETISAPPRVIPRASNAPTETAVEPEIIKSSTRPSIFSAGAHRSLSTLAESEEVDSTEPTSTSAPTRKLTRGKAIRRSSSGLIKTLTPTSPSEVVAAPLFSAARFDFGKSQTTESDRPFIHRASAPEVHSFANDKRSRGDRRSEDHGFKVLGGRRLGDPPLNPIKKKEVDMPNGGEVEVIPPHREAALLRRESILAKYVRPPPPPTSNSMSKPLPPDPKISPIARRESFPSGPLIDFSDYDSISNTSHHPEIPGLVAANAELLELLEQEASLPQSSSQAASKAQLVEDLKAQLQSIGEESRERTPPPLPPRNQPITHVQGAIKKKSPPPPPPIRARNWTSGQKISIAETATSPITPRPSIRRPNLNEGSPTRQQPPPIPTRRPPPPPPPPLFRAISEVTSTTSSLFDGENSQTSTSTIAPLPPKPPLWRGLSSGKFDRSPQKPRGPRPAPPAPRRSWARVVSDHPLDRTHSEEVLSLNNVDGGDNVDELTSPTRSTSEMDLSRPVIRPRRVAEYTDLDVFVSRLEGSGREYEVSPLSPFPLTFTQLTTRDSTT